jgi:anti-sigma B factor antagonist
MALTISTHRVGNVTVLTCSGRIVQGSESEKLRQFVTDALKHGPFIVLDFHDVEFLDSSGLGLLARLLDRARAAAGNLKVCALSPKLRDVLRITRLDRIFETYESQDEAIAAFSSPPSPAATPVKPPPDILCVDPSADVLAYFREVMRQAGYAAITADNAADAVKLLRAAQPKLVAIGAVTPGDGDARALDTLYKLAQARGLIELPEGFSTQDAGAAGRDLVERVKAKLSV